MKNWYQKAFPYIKMLRLPHQFSVSVIALFAALDVHYFNIPNLFQIIVGLTCLSIMMFLVNDYFDAKDTDKFSPRERTLTKNRVSPQIVLALWVFFALCGSLLLLKFHLYWQTALLLFFGTFYTAPPLRFKATFPWDLFSLAFWPIVGYSIPYTLSGLPLTSIINTPFLTLCLILLLSEMIHFITDIEPDTKAGLKNTAVVLSPNTLLRIAKLCLIGSALGLGVLIYRHTNWWYYPLILVIPYVGYAVGRLREVMYEPEKGYVTLNAAYSRAMKMGNYLVLYEIAVFVYLLASRV